MSLIRVAISLQLFFFAICRSCDLGEVGYAEWDHTVNKCIRSPTIEYATTWNRTGCWYEAENSTRVIMRKGETHYRNGKKLAECTEDFRGDTKMEVHGCWLDDKIKQKGDLRYVSENKLENCSEHEGWYSWKKSGCWVPRVKGGEGNVVLEGGQQYKEEGVLVATCKMRDMIFSNWYKLVYHVCNPDRKIRLPGSQWVEDDAALRCMPANLEKGNSASAQTVACVLEDGRFIRVGEKKTINGHVHWCWMSSCGVLMQFLDPTSTDFAYVDQMELECDRTIMDVIDNMK